MRLWPWLMDLTVVPEDGKPFHLWLPLCLLWPLLALVAVLAFAISIPVDLILVMAGRSYHHYTLLLFGLFGLFADTRGTVIRVNDDKNHVDMTLY